MRKRGMCMGSNTGFRVRISGAAIVLLEIAVEGSFGNLGIFFHEQVRSFWATVLLLTVNR